MPDLDILRLVRLCFKHGEGVIKELLYKREIGDDMGVFVSRLEDVLKERSAKLQDEQLKSEIEAQKNAAELKSQQEQ